jgi:hypothetical protein
MLQVLKFSGQFCIMNETEETGNFKGEEQEAYAKFGRWDSKRKGRKLPGEGSDSQQTLRKECEKTFNVSFDVVRYLLQI